MADRFDVALRRYCNQRIRYNERERRAIRLGGVRSLAVGIPIVVLATHDALTPGAFGAGAVCHDCARGGLTARPAGRRLVTATASRYRGRRYDARSARGQVHSQQRRRGSRR